MLCIKTEAFRNATLRGLMNTDESKERVACALRVNQSRELGTEVGVNKPFRNVGTYYSTER